MEAMAQNTDPDEEVSPHVAKHAIREAHRRAARLLSFGSSVMYAEHGSVLNEQSILAIDDLVSFAIHVRRALDVLGAKSQFVDLTLINGRSPVATKYINDPTVETDISFLELLSRVVHSKRLGISMTEAETERTIKARRSLLMARDFYPHHFWVKSDRPGFFTVCIESFVLTYLQHVEPKLDTLCWEAGFVSPNEEHFHIKKPKEPE